MCVESICDSIHLEIFGEKKKNLILDFRKTITIYLFTK